MLLLKASKQCKANACLLPFSSAHGGDGDSRKPVSESAVGSRGRPRHGQRPPLVPSALSWGGRGVPVSQTPSTGAFAVAVSNPPFGDGDRTRSLSSVARPDPPLGSY